MSNRGTTSKAGALVVYAELPASAEQRASCFAAAAEFQKQSPSSMVLPKPPTSERYLVVHVRR